MSTTRSFIVLLSLSVGLTSPAARAADPKSLSLENGLRVLLQPISGSGKIALVTFITVGNDHDPPGQSGLAHYLEHLYITAKAGEHPARTAETFMKTYPDGWNAQTTNDFTVVATVFRAAKLRDELEEAAARMSQLEISQDDLDRELPRLIDEVRNMYGRIPALAARNLAYEKVRPAIPEGRRGGVPEQLRKLSVETIQKRWEKYYKARNALVVLLGDFELKAAARLVKSAFNSVPRGEAAPKATTLARSEPGDIETVNVEAVTPMPRTHVAVAYRAPEWDSRDLAPFLLVISRLRQKAATSREVQVDFPLLLDREVVVLKTETETSEDPAKAVERIDEFLAEALTAPVTPMERLSAQGMFAFTLGTRDLPLRQLNANLYGAALAMGTRVLAGIDSKGLARELGEVETKDVQRIAAEYFNSERRGALVVIPADRDAGED